MKKKMLAAVLAGTMVMSLGTNLCWADGEKTKVTMTVWNGEWGDQLDRTMESFNSKHDDIELDITMQSGDYSDFLGTAAATNDWISTSLHHGHRCRILQRQEDFRI